MNKSLTQGRLLYLKWLELEYSFTRLKRLHFSLPKMTDLQLFQHVRPLCNLLVYAIAMCPSMVNIRLKVNSGVESFVIRGADLMWPGVSSASIGLGDIKKGAVAAILVNGSAPVGVGQMETDSVPEMNKGKAVIVHHSMLDELWMSGP
jgi:predicted RNA-binding protein (TIGR00451 family)